MASAPAIGFEYRSPRRLSQAVLAMGALAAWSIWLCGLPIIAKALMSAAVVLLASRAAWRVAHSPVVAAGWGDGDQWTLRFATQSDAAATLLSSRVLGGFVMLRLDAPGNGVQTLLLGPDNADVDIRRRLRMRLANQPAAVSLPGD